MALVKGESKAIQEEDNYDTYAFTVLLTASGYNFSGYEDDSYNHRDVTMVGRYKIHVRVNDDMDTEDILESAFRLIENDVVAEYRDRCKIDSLHTMCTRHGGRVYASIHSPLMIVSPSKSSTKFHNLLVDLSVRPYSVVWKTSCPLKRHLSKAKKKVLRESKRLFW
jgi:hypothetical protein